MCGIVAYVGPSDAVPILLDGLRRLEYRGYDSAGIAVACAGRLHVHKVAGRIGELAATRPSWLEGKRGIGHTRWATHGRPSRANAHPHTDASGTIAVVHNGIVENAERLRAGLVADGVAFRSDTDSEVLAHLIAAAGDGDLEDLVRRALAQVEGAVALAVLSARQPDRVLVARHRCPVVVGLADGETLAASDVAALADHATRTVPLDDGELAVLTEGGCRTLTFDARETTKAFARLAVDAAAFDKGRFTHFMRKEIDEQPPAIERTLAGRLDVGADPAALDGLELLPVPPPQVRRLKVLGCGSAFYAGLLGAHLLERLTGVPADAEAASEFRYRFPIIERDTLYIAVSQSGETADTLAAVEQVQTAGAYAIGIVNTVGSSVASRCDATLYLRAGPEVSVAATKTFTCTAVAFVLLGLHLAGLRGDLGDAHRTRLVDGLRALPAHVEEVLTGEQAIAEVAGDVAGAAHAFFVGRVLGYPVALEGAQKLKEVSYLHAEAYPAAELKHGPLALVEPGMPAVAVVPDDPLLAKNRSTLEEIRARGGHVIALSHGGVTLTAADRTLTVPRNEPELDPVLLNVPLQLLAYHAALALGRDVDQPRNLAKSVTVE